MDSVNANLASQLRESKLAVEGALRVAPLCVLPQLLADCGLDPDAELRELGFDPVFFNEPENTITFADMGHLLVGAAALTGCASLGLEVGRRSGIEILGIIGRACRFAPDVGTALRFLILHLHLHDRGAIPALWEGGDEVMLGYTIHSPGVPGTDHIYDGSLAIIHNIVAELVGKHWRATEVQLCRTLPTDIAPYTQHFGNCLRFRAERAAIVFPASDLKLPLASADPRAYAQALKELAALDALHNPGLANKVHRVLLNLLINGSGPDDIGVHSLARLFELHPRTFNRRLRAEGTTFSNLLGEARFEIARQLLRDTRLQIMAIANTLGYADSASFDHAFQRWSGQNATEWRAQHRAD